MVYTYSPYFRFYYYKIRYFVLFLVPILGVLAYQSTQTLSDKLLVIFAFGVISLLVLLFLVLGHNRLDIGYGYIPQEIETTDQGLKIKKDNRVFHIAWSDILSIEEGIRLAARPTNPLNILDPTLHKKRWLVSFKETENGKTTTGTFAFSVLLNQSEQLVQLIQNHIKTSSNSPESELIKPLNKYNLPFIIFMLAVTFIVCGAIFWVSLFRPFHPRPIPQLIAPSITPVIISPSPVLRPVLFDGKLNTSKWKTLIFNNLQIKYPPQWTIDDTFPAHSASMSAHKTLIKPNLSNYPSTPDAPTYNLLIMDFAVKTSSKFPSELASNFNQEFGFPVQNQGLKGYLVEDGLFAGHPAAFIYQDIGDVTPQKYAAYPIHIIFTISPDTIGLITTQFFYQQDASYKEKTIEEIATILNNIKIVTASISKNAWKTYTDQENNFSFSYPIDYFTYRDNKTSGFFVATSAPKGGSGPKFLDTNSVWFSVEVLDAQHLETFMEYYNSLPDYYANKNFTETQIAGRTGYIVSYSSPMVAGNVTTYTYQAYVFHNNKLLALTFSSWQSDVLDKNKTLFNQIISNWKFSDLAKPTTVTWSSYTEPTYKFSFTYPSSFTLDVPPSGSLTYNKQLDLVHFMTDDRQSGWDVTLDQHPFTLDFLKKYAPTALEDIPPDPKVLAGKTFYYYGPGGGGVCYADQYFFNLNNQILRFSFFDENCPDKTPSQSTKQIEYQILSSLKGNY